MHTEIGDAGLAHLRGLKDIERLWLTRTRVTDAGLVHLASLTRLKQLDLMGCQITDNGIACLENMKELEELNLIDTMVGDAGIARLTGLTKLGVLNLNHTNVTHASLSHLKKFPTLRHVGISGTGILPSALWYELPKIEDARLTTALVRPTVIEFVETPLVDLIDFLKDYHRVEIVLDRPAFRETGIDPEVPITRNARCPLGEAMEQMLKPLGLKCVPWHEVLLITADKPRSGTLPRLVIGANESLSKELAAVLHGPTVTEFVKTPLEDVLSYLGDRHGLKFVIHENELGASQPPVTIKLRGIAAATALELMLNDLDLHAVIKDNTLHVHAGPIPRESQERQ